MPQGKAAGERCVNLDTQTNLCRIWGTDIYPEVCRRFNAATDTCGDSREEALALLNRLELATSTAATAGSRE